MKKGGAPYFILFIAQSPEGASSCLVKLTLLFSSPAEGIAFQNPICQGQSIALQGKALTAALRSVATLSNHTSGGFKSAHQCYEWRRYIKMINTSRDIIVQRPEMQMFHEIICHVRKFKITKYI